MPTLSENLPGMMAFAGVTLMLVILLRKYFRYQSKLKREARREARPMQASAAAQRAKLEAPVEVKRWEVQFHETCRDLQAELDSKMRALQILIAHANAAADRLERAQGSVLADDSVDENSSDENSSEDATD